MFSSSKFVDNLVKCAVVRNLLKFGRWVAWKRLRSMAIQGLWAHDFFCPRSSRMCDFHVFLKIQLKNLLKWNHPKANIILVQWKKDAFLLLFPSLFSFLNEWFLLFQVSPNEENFKKQSHWLDWSLPEWFTHGWIDPDSWYPESHRKMHKIQVILL